MKEVIVLCGNAGHGKDTFANILHKLIPNSRRDSFAAPIKVIAEMMIGISPSLSNAPNDIRDKTMVYGRSVRSHLQRIGTEMGREMVHPDIWFHRFADRAMQAKEGVTIGSDGRFRNEIVGLREYLAGKAIVRAIRIVRPSVEVKLTHPSETEIASLPNSLFNHVVLNDSTIESLEDIARHFIGLWAESEVIA